MTVLLVRHARAGRRQDWPGDDRLRPLSERGRSQAAGLASSLAAVLGPQRTPVSVLASPWLRCVQTVEPLAQVLGVAVVATPDLVEGRGEAAIKLLREIDHTTVICTHGDVVGDVLAWLSGRGVDLGRHPTWPKGATWVLQRRAKVIHVARYLAPPA